MAAELEADDYETIKSWTGDDVTDDEIFEIYERTESIDATILEILRGKMLEAVTTPTQVSLPSGLSVSYSGQPQSYASIIKAFTNQGGTDGLSDTTASVVRIVRPDYR